MVPGIDNYDELILADSMNIDSLKWKGAKLRASFGGGYGAFAVVDAPSGLHRWSLSAGVLPAHNDYGNLVNNTNRFDYYFSFFRDHTTGDQEIFWITFRGKKYHAAFVEPEISFERFTDDLFGGGVEIEQRKVPGVTYYADGSIFDPTDLAGVWGYYEGDDLTLDLTLSGHDLDTHGNIISGPAVNGRETSRFNNGVTKTGYLNTPADPKIYEAYFAIKINGATFPNYSGILTADATVAALVGNSGDTKLNNFTFGVGYTYRLNGTLLTEATQNAPMNTFGVMHAKWAAGLTLNNLQIGKDRAATDRYLEADIAAIVLCDAALSAEASPLMDTYLKRILGIL